jgi:hypothetical protein
MTGTVDTMSLSDAKQESASQQSRLGSFGSGSGTTYIGIANSERETYLDAVDEVEPRLAPPSPLFHQWYNTRERLMDEEGLSETMAHNEALKQIDYFDRFEDHLNTTQAQEALTMIAERVKDGADIVLVCYCGGAKQCHRHPVAKRINARV